MRLAEFITSNIESILQEWEDFARTLETPGKPLDTEGLRDHAELMLQAFSNDLRTWQSIRQQAEKSKGHATTSNDTAAQTHAVTRLHSGFTIDQVLAEFRALRASVIRLWMKHLKSAGQFEMEDMIRFNEAIDQALAESVASYTQAVQASRNIFLGILGHDLRTPLSAILLGADALLRTDSLGDRASKISSGIYSSVKRASQIVGDLLDFTRSQLGPGLPVSKASIDLAPICERIVEELRVVNPTATIVFQSTAAVSGDFDGSRLEQMFSNLIGNALQHGDALAPVTVSLLPVNNFVVFKVHNSGAVIPEAVLSSIFNPMGRYSPGAAVENGPLASLGLGLFIAAEIAAAHGGRIEVMSDVASGTQFVVSLPLSGNTDSAPQK